MARAISFDPPPEGNALADLSETQLWNAQVLATLACSRGKASVTRRREQYFCFVGRALKVEADLRGVPSPPSHTTTADLRKT